MASPLSYDAQWVTLANRALLRIGSEQISSLDDGSQKANYCLQLLPQAVETVYSSYHWRIASKAHTAGPACRSTGLRLRIPVRTARRLRTAEERRVRKPLLHQQQAHPHRCDRGVRLIPGAAFGSHRHARGDTRPRGPAARLSHQHADTAQRRGLEPAPAGISAGLRARSHQGRNRTVPGRRDTSLVRRKQIRGADVASYTVLQNNFISGEIIP